MIREFFLEFRNILFVGEKFLRITVGIDDKLFVGRSNLKLGPVCQGQTPSGKPYYNNWNKGINLFRIIKEYVLFTNIGTLSHSSLKILKLMNEMSQNNPQKISTITDTGKANE